MENRFNELKGYFLKGIYSLRDFRAICKECDLEKQSEEFLYEIVHFKGSKEEYLKSLKA